MKVDEDLTCLSFINVDIFLKRLTLNLTAVGESAHTVFEGLILKKLFIVKNLKKICNPCLISPEHFVLKAFL